MSEASDWEPLPEAARIAHPGELGVDRGPSSAPSPRPPAPPAPAAPAAADPAAEAAFRALQQRCAAAPPASSLVAEVQHRQQRAARRRAAAAAPFAADARPVQSSLRSADEVPLPLELEPPADRDPREDDPWFGALPAAERERLRGVWSRQVATERGAAAAARGVRDRRSAAALLVAVLVVVLGTHSAWWCTLLGGGLCAVLWRRSAADRMRDPILAVSCLGIARVLPLVTHGLSPQSLVFDAMLTIVFAALVGFDGEMRRTGGFDAA